MVDGSGRGAAAVPAATIGANLFSYLLLLAAARRLSQAAYGELLAELGVLLLGTVAALALQTVAARLTATRTPTASLGRTSLLVAGATGGAIVIITPLLQRFLHLGTPFGLLAVAAATPATAVLGTYQGISQGRRWFGRLGTLIALTTGGRSIGGLVGVLIGRSPLWALIGLALGVNLALGAAVRWLGRPDRLAASTGPAAGPAPTAGTKPAAGAEPAAGAAPASGPGSVRALALEVAHAAHAHGAFLLLTSLDVLLARHVLRPDAAGVYGVGSVVSRAALWLPQSVALLMFATLTDRARHRQAFGRAVLTVGALAGLTVAACAVAGRVVVSVVGGAQYHALDSYMWRFASLGAALAVTQLVVMAGLALSRRGRIALIWANAVADVAVVLVVAPRTPQATVSILAAISAITATACLGVGFARRTRAGA